MRRKQSVLTPGLLEPDTRHIVARLPLLSRQSALPRAMAIGAALAAPESFERAMDGARPRIAAGCGA
jgi:hypothetical protein